MSYSSINIDDIKFDDRIDHNPGVSIPVAGEVKFVTPWMRVSSYPRTYIALRDTAGNDIERVNVFTEITDEKFKKWLSKLQSKAQEELRQQSVDLHPEVHWNELLAHKKYLRIKLHVRPSKMLQLDCYKEGNEKPFTIKLSEVSNYFYTDIQIRYVLEMRPILCKNNRCGISLRACEVEFKDKEKTKLRD